MVRRHARFTLFPYTTLFRSALGRVRVRRGDPGGASLLERMAMVARGHEVQHGWNAVCGLVEYHWLAGHTDGGAEELKHAYGRSEEHTSELQSRPHLVCRLLL